MNKAELETKHLAELHSLAAEAGVERYRMLTRTELVEQLAGGGDSDAEATPARQPRPPRGEGGGQRERSRSRRRRPPREREEAPKADEDEPSSEPTEREAAPEADRDAAPAKAKPSPESGRGAAPGDDEAAAPARPRRRRRRRFGRRGKQEVTLQGLLLPPESGRQAALLGESREACTTLLRSVAADLADAAKGPDPVALLIDPSPEELADWKREAPQAEIVAAGQPRHADDALAQAKSRASSGEDVILLVDSLTRLAEAYGDADAAKQFFDAGRAQGSAGSGSLTVVAALERS
jgi:Rho termination factor-like protein